jgi:hypothetical protein
MSKTKYRGSLTKEQIKELEVERQEMLEELAKKKDKDVKRRQLRGGRHFDWSEDTGDE